MKRCHDSREAFFENDEEAVTALATEGARRLLRGRNILPSDVLVGDKSRWAEFPGALKTLISVRPKGSEDWVLLCTAGERVMKYVLKCGGDELKTSKGFSVPLPITHIASDGKRLVAASIAKPGQGVPVLVRPLEKLNRKMGVDFRLPLGLSCRGLFMETLESQPYVVAVVSGVQGGSQILLYNLGGGEEKTIELGDVLADSEVISSVCMSVNSGSNSSTLQLAIGSERGNVSVVQFDLWGKTELIIKHETKQSSDEKRPVSGIRWLDESTFICSYGNRISIVSTILKVAIVEQTATQKDIGSMSVSLDGRGLLVAAGPELRLLYCGPNELGSPRIGTHLYSKDVGELGTTDSVTNKKIPPNLTALTFIGDDKFAMASGNKLVAVRKKREDGKQEVQVMERASLYMSPHCRSASLLNRSFHQDALRFALSRGETSGAAVIEELLSRGVLDLSLKAGTVSIFNELQRALVKGLDSPHCDTYSEAINLMLTANHDILRGERHVASLHEQLVRSVNQLELVQRDYRWANELDAMLRIALEDN